MKEFFYASGNAGILDHILFKYSQFKYWRKNRRFRAAFPEFSIPPDYYLYETYLADYEKYQSDGLLAAKEILEWTDAYCGQPLHQILEWGCGVGRIVRHLPDMLPATTMIHACDINQEMIAWDNKNLPGIQFSAIDGLPPTAYPDKLFDLVFAISVLTHIQCNEQVNWIREIHRIMEPDGVFLFTTHGEKFIGQLSVHERKKMNESGYFTRSFKHKGHRMMTTYNEAGKLKELISPLFRVLEFHDGKKDIAKTGGQDLWIVCKIQSSRR